MNKLNIRSTKHVPVETKVFYGMTYSVGVADGGFKIFIVDWEDPIEDVVECSDVSPGNTKELLARAHAHARRLIRDKYNSQG